MSTIIKLDNGYLETNGDTKIPLTISISDIKDLSKRKGTFSKSIDIPGTKNNNMVLNNYFDVNILSGSFDINKIVKCAIVQDGIIILDNAIIQLINISTIQTNSMTQNIITYTLLVKDVTSDFYSKISNKKLEDIDLSPLNHQLNANSIINSYDNTVVNGYKYVMAYNPMSIDDVKFNINEFTPGVYVRKYLDAIFNDVGYFYNWKGANDNDIQLDRLIIPYNGDGRLPDMKANESFSITVSKEIVNPVYTGYKLGYAKTGIKPHKIVNLGDGRINNYFEISDVSNLFEDVVGNYNIPPLNGNNRLDISIKLDAITTVLNPGIERILKRNYNTPSNILFTLKSFINIYYDDNTLIKSIDLNSISNQSDVILNDGYVISVGENTLSTNSYDIMVSLEEVDLNRKIYFTRNIIYNSIDGDWNYSPQSGPNALVDFPKFRLELQNLEINILPYTSQVGYNTTVKMNDYIPRNVKQSDFLKGLFTMFNIYADIDSNNDKTINLYKRDSYYDNGVEKDWSSKIVKNKEQDLKFLPEISKKKILLTYKEDRDWANEQYKGKTSEIFGQAEFIFDNEYVDGVNKIETLFSPTPMYNISIGAIVPIILGDNVKNNIRILYDGGKRECSDYEIWNYPSQEFFIGNVVNVSFYPYISHWDRPKSPNFDLNFLPPDFYFRTDDFGGNTNNNLYNLHWRRTMNQLNKGKLLTAYFNLTSLDIFKLKLSDKIFIENSWWNINAIKDYDANSIEPTKVELISIDDELKVDFITKDSVSLLKTSPILKGFNVMSMDSIRSMNRVSTISYFYLSGFNNTVIDKVKGGSLIGNNNQVNKSSFIIGDGNKVGEKSLIIGNNNKVGNNVEGSIVLGNNINATQSNSIYCSNIFLSGDSTINGTPIENILDERFVYQQPMPLDEWVINHNLNRLPIVFIVDTAGTIITGQIIYIDLNNVGVYFNSTVAGTAYLH